MHEPSDNFVDTLKVFIESMLRNVYTATPALVVGVDLESNSVDVQPLIRRRDSDNTQHDASIQYSVPLHILSADSGRFKITMPVSAGDTVMLFYSQRDLQFFHGSDGKTIVDSGSPLAHNSNPVFAVAGLFTRTNTTNIPTNSLYIQADNASIDMNQNGDIQMVGRNINLQSNSLTHNGVNIGDTHVHGGVRSGGSNTSSPQ